MCMSCQIVIDQTRSNQFAEKMLSHLNSAAVALMCSIGHRAGIFDAMAELPPSSSDRIAGAAGLNERYVREWLGAMVTGRIVEYDPENKTYFLPAEHAAWLTRKASPNNMAVTAQWIPVLASVEDRLVESFRNGGGVAYEEFKRFHDVMADESHQTVVVPLIEHLLPLAEGTRERLNAGIHVLDVGCGRGRAMLKMAELFPRSRFVGYDISADAVENANREARRSGLANVSFQVKDAAQMEEREAFDLIFTFDAVHDQARPQAVLNNIHRALKNGGTYFMQDIAGSSYVEKNADHPMGPLMYAVSCAHCMTVSLAQGGEGLGAMWGNEKALEMLSAAGFRSVEIKKLPHDVINDYYIVRKS